MTNTDGISAAAAKHRQAQAALRAAFAPSASAGNDHATLDRYMEIRARIACPDHLRDEYMAEARPGLSRAVDDIQRRMHGRAAERRRLTEAAADAHRDALLALGIHFGARLAERIGEDPATLVAPLVDEAYIEASEFRFRHIDGFPLAYDPDGPFTRTLHEAVAAAKGMPTRGAYWLRNVVDRLGQTAFADVSCPPSRVAVLEAARLCPVRIGGPDPCGRVRVTVRIRPSEIRAALDLVGSDPATFEVSGPFVTDPHFRFPRAEATADAVVQRPLEELDDAELAGRTAALTWERAACLGAASLRAAALLGEDGQSAPRFR